ncbi:MAG: lactate utilization protein [Desulfobacteraceae bacterium]|nr:MAG: lactate utilization protein [Desulfobacteraceae bacterium]
MQTSDLIQLLKEKAEAVQAVVVKIKTLKEAFQYTVDLTREQRGTSMVAMGLKTQDVNLLEKACKTADISFIKPPLRSHANEIHTALTPVDWGIAETGTLVLDSSSEDVRIATMLSETHVALLPVSKIKPDVTALENEINAVLKADGSSYYAFITGASRTADIERVLAIGVHGPQELHILIMEENRE